VRTCASAQVRKCCKWGGAPHLGTWALAHVRTRLTVAV